MIRTTKLTKGQKLYFMGVSGVEECEVYIPTVYMSTPIMREAPSNRLGNWGNSVLHATIHSVVSCQDNRIRTICTADLALYFYTYEECLANLDRLIEMRQRTLDNQK